MKLQLNLFVGIFLGAHSLFGQTPQSQVPQSFILQKPEAKKKYSTNELKEKLGHATEQAFDTTTHVTENLGKLQTALADQHKALSNSGDIAGVHGALGRIQQTICSIQRMCSSVVKKLIDNEAPFKKAKKQTLEISLEALTAAHTGMARAAHDLEACCKSLKPDASCVQELKKVAQGHEKAIVAVHERIKQDDCLKNI